jgi:rubrerythrin
MFSAREILDFAIKIERNAEALYREAASKMENPEIGSLLLFLADEERRHAEWFQQRKETIKLEGDEAEMERLYGTLLRDMIGDQTFSLAEADLSRMDHVKSLLELAVEFENDTILFYETLHSLIDDAHVTSRLQEIISDENGHIQMLNEKMPPCSRE